jgi:hypothetical protein
VCPVEDVRQGVFRPARSRPAYAGDG